MIWLSWRRHRTTTLVVLAALVVLGLWMAWLGHAFESKPGAEVCRMGPCGTWNGPFSYGRQAAIINVLLLFLPCLIGIVFGAPLVAGELEQHTNRLAWTQSISRQRWLTTKWLVVGLPLVGSIAAMTLIAQWWTGHTYITVMPNVLENLAGNRLLPAYFGITGVVPIVYALFAFALGACLGAVIRRTDWAAVATIAIYGALTLVMVFAIRPNLITPRFAADRAPMPAHSWVLGNGFRFTDATIPPSSASADTVARACLRTGGANYVQCLNSHHLVHGLFFQPPSVYWTLQWAESGIYLGATILLVGATLWVVRRWRA